MAERVVTSGPGGRILTNCGVWSPCGNWIAFDARSDAAGERFDGTRIEAVHADTGEVRTLYESRNGANCGVAIWHPMRHAVAFILGPENPTDDWNYGPTRRQGVLVEFDRPGLVENLDSRDLVPPFTPGALRGGSHVHVFDPTGTRFSFTYEDEFPRAHPGGDANLRTIAVGTPGPVRVPRTHSRNHDGHYFCAVVAEVTADPRPGSDDIRKAFDEAWIDPHRIAFLGHVVGERGEPFTELFTVELAADLTRPGDGPLEGTATRRPAPPRGCVQRRLTFTEKRPFPGVGGPRFWPRASPTTHRIGFLMPDNAGVPQFWTTDPACGIPRQETRLKEGITSAFTWLPDGERVAFASGPCLVVLDVRTGRVVPFTSPSESPPRPEACVASPDGRRVAFVRHCGGTNQVCVADMPPHG